MNRICLLIYALSLLVACDGPVTPSLPATDAGDPLPDASPLLDGAVPADGGVPADGSLPDDGSVSVDGGVPDDGSVSDDGSIPFDGGGAELDGSTPDGGTVSPDGGGSVDAGEPDAGPPGCSPAACDDGVSCTEDACAEDGRCVHLLLETACRSGQYCDLSRGCVDGTPCSVASDCTDSDPCTIGERCDTSFPRRCTHHILDADGDREPSMACGGSDCDDAVAGTAAMAHQVCGSAVDADCDGLVAFDDLIGTTACATDVLRGGMAVCSNSPWLDFWGSGVFLPTPVLNAARFELDVSACVDPRAAVTALAACQSRASCESATTCSVTAFGIFPGGGMSTQSVGATWTGCAADFRAACACSSLATPCVEAVESLCAGDCALLGRSCSVTTVTGSPPSFDVCRNLNSDVQSCGACGHVCTTGDSCIRATCCAPTDADCDGNPATSCETDLLTANANCGACGHVCTTGDSCIRGTCCAATAADCDGDPATSCETDLLTSNAHCGACGHVCGTGTSCVAGVCMAPPPPPPPPPASGDTCGVVPVPLTASGTYPGTTVSMVSDYTLRCGGGTDPDAAFIVRLTEAYNVQATATVAGGLAEVAIRPLSACATGPDLRCASGTIPSTLAHSLLAGDYAVIVKTAVSGRFDLTLDLTPPTPALPVDRCAADTQDISAGGTFTGAFVDLEDDYALRCGPSGAKDAALRFTLAAPKDVVITSTTSSPATPTTYLSLTTDCASSSAALRCGGFYGTATIRTLRLPAGTYYVLVESSDLSASGWSVTATFTAPVTPSLGDTCLSPVDITSASGRISLPMLGLDGDSSCASYLATSRDAYFMFDVAALSDVQLTVTSPGWSDVVALQATCGAVSSERRCLATNGTRVHLIPNVPPGRYYVMVATDVATGSVSASVAFLPPTPVPMNDTCAGAIVLTPPSVFVRGTLAGVVDDIPSGSCGGGGAADAFYRFSIGVPTQFSAIATRVGGGTQQLVLRSGGCSGAEAACASASPTASIDLALVAGTYYLQVEQSTLDGLEGDFTLNVFFTPL